MGSNQVLKRASGRNGDRQVTLRVLVVAFLTVMTQACGSQGNGESGAKPEAAPAKRTLRLASIDPTCTINPAAAAGWATASYGFAETLTRQTLDGSIEPWLLSSSTRTSPLEWQFRLREGVRFHNGRAVDAAAVVASLEARAKETHNPDPVSTGKLTVTGPLTFTQLKAIGVTATLAKESVDTYYGDLDKNNNTPILALTYINRPILKHIDTWVISTALVNTQGWKRPQFDAQFNEARATVDPAKRGEILDDLQRQLYDEGGDIVWGFVEGPDGGRKGLRGVEYAEGTPFFGKASLG